MRSIQYLTLDINKRTQQTITANVGDVGSRFVKIQIVDEGKPINLIGVDVFLYALKSDNTKLFNGVVVEDDIDGIVLAELTSQLLVQSGNVKLTLVLIEGNNKLSSKEFTLNVENSIFNDKAIESTNEFGALTTSLVKVEEWNGYFEETSGQIEQKYTTRLNTLGEQFNTKVDKNGINQVSEEMLTQSLKEKLVAGGSVAVVGNNSVGLGQFATTIQNDIGEWKEQTVNLVSETGYDPSTGKPSSSLDSRVVSFEISATSGDRFKLSGFTFGGDTYMIMFIDSSDNLISKVGTELSWSTPTNYEFTCPSKTAKIRMNSWSNNAVKTVSKLTYSSIATKKEVEKSYTDLNNLKIDKIQGVGMEQFNTTIQKDVGVYSELSPTDSDYAYSINGSNIAIEHTASGTGNGHFVTDVKEGEIYKLTLDTPPSTSVYGILFTDENMKVLKSDLQGKSDITRYTDYEISVPKGSKKLIVSFRKGSSYIHDFYKLNYSPIATKAEINKLHPYQIPSFYENHVNEKIKTIKSLENAYGSQGETIAFITDIHYPNNNMYSFPILKKLIEETNLSYVICGGDSIRDDADLNIGKQHAYDFMKIVRANVGNKFVTIYGNHDNNSNQSTTLTSDEVYSAYFKHQENIVKPDTNKLNGLYWYLDNPIQKIRYIGLNTFEGTEGVLSVAQMKWLCEVALVLPTDGWNIAFFTHRTADPTRTGALGEFRQIIRAIRYQSNYSATYTDYNEETYDINVSYAGKKHSVLFVANGHNHYDTLNTDNGIAYFMSTCDALYKDDDSVPAREGINMQSFDIVTINKKTNTVNLTKIGAGSDRSFQFTNNNV